MSFRYLLVDAREVELTVLEVVLGQPPPPLVKMLLVE